MSLSEIIKAKLKRLEKVPEVFLSELQRTEKEYFKKILIVLNSFEQDKESFLLNDANINALAEIDSRLKSLFLETDYVNKVNEFIQQFDQQAELNDEYYKKAFPKSKIPEEAFSVLTLNKEQALNELLGNSVDVNFVSGVKKIIKDAIITQSSFSDTLSAFQMVITGDGETDSKIMQYSKQVAFDLFADNDRAYSKTVADAIGAEWFLYSGDVIPTSREFCIERHNHYYHRKEIEAWGEGEKTNGLSLPEKDGEWPGMKAGTNKETIFKYAGGHQCKHSILAVSIFSVPKEVIERNISQGFFKPSQSEIEELGLAA